MYNEMNALERVESDIAQVTRELQKVVELVRAVSVLLSKENDYVEQSPLTVHEAAKLIANEHPAVFGEPNATLEDSLRALGNWEEGLREELDSFTKAREDLFLRARSEAVKFVVAELDDLDRKTKKVDPDEKFYAGQKTAYENVLEVLNTFEYPE